MPIIPNPEPSDTREKTSGSETGNIVSGLKNTTLADFLEVSQFLAQVSTKLYGLKSQDAIFNTVVNEFKPTKKFLASIVVLSDNQKTGIMEYTSIGDGLIKKAEKFTGLSRYASAISIKNSENYTRIIEDHAIICKPSVEMFLDVLPSVVRKVSGALVKMLGIRHMSISAPIYCCGRIVAILGISSPGIIKELEDSVSVLAGHISTALEYAQQYQAREEAEADLRRALAEKEVMLREIHHRVKNNMQIISSMLSLQSDRITDEETTELLKEIRSRINSIAAVHTELYRSDDLARIDIGGYFIKLTKHCSQMYYRDNAPPNVSVMHCDLMMNVNQAIPCGLIVNELVCNSLKHGFPDDNGTRPVIIVETEMNESRISITVRDNGIGLPDGFSLDTDANFGLEIVRTLTENQLDGTMHLENDNGLAVKVSFILQD